MGREPIFLNREVQANGATYEVYRADDPEDAKEFLRSRTVDQPLRYVVVETPDGNWGVDIEGLYLERLRPWQLGGGAECPGRIHAVASVNGVLTAARGATDNFIVQVRCGRCGRIWFDGVRHQAETLVRCPACGTRNSVDCSGVSVVERGDRWTVTSIHPLLDGSGPGARSTDVEAARDDAIAALRAGVTATPPGHPHRAGRLANLATALHERFDLQGRPADLDAAVTALAEAVSTGDPADGNRLEHLFLLGIALTDRWEHSGRKEDLDQAIAALADAAGTSARSGPDRPRYLSRLGLALRDRFELTSRLADLDDAVAAGRGSVDGSAADDPSRPMRTGILAATLRVRFEHVGRRDDLDDAIVTGRAAVASAPPGHDARAACLTSLGLALHERYKHAGTPEDLDQAIEAFEEVVRTVPADAGRWRYQHNLSRALRERYGRAGRPEDLERSVVVARAAVDGVSTRDSVHARTVSNLAAALHAWFELTGRPGDIEESIAMSREAVRHISAEHSDLPLVLAELGTALVVRFKNAGEPTDLDEAVAVLGASVERTPADHPDRTDHVDALGIALQERFGHTGREADLDEAVVAGREAVARSAPGQVGRARRMANLAGALGARYRRNGYPGDSEESIAVTAAALDSVLPDDPHRPTYLFNHTSGLMERSQRTGEAADLDAALKARRDGIAATPPGHTHRVHLLSGLSSVLRMRYQRSGADHDLAEAVETARAAVAASTADHPRRAGALIGLAKVLLLRSERTASPTDLDDAVAAVHDALEVLPADHPDRATALAMLGGLLNTRFARTRRREDLYAAVIACSSAAEVTSAPPEDRMNAGQLGAFIAIDAGYVQLAADAFAGVVRLLPLFAWHGLPRSTREDHLAGWSGLAANAAACMTRAGRPEQAVELLEIGRSVLWAQLLDLRTDLTALAEQAPGLAARLDQIRSVLDSPIQGSPERLAPVGDRVTTSSDPEKRMRLAREFDELVARVRAIDGFEEFLRPTSFARLTDAAAGGPVAVVNASRYGCHALVVLTDGVRVVDLPDLRHADVVAHGDTLLAVLAAVSDRTRPFLDRERDRHSVLDMLEWLWRTAAEPVLAAIGHDRPPAKDVDTPRIWWCPTGALTLLPLHAAGYHARSHTADDPTGPDTVSERAISSYTPTLTALLRARATRPSGPAALLAVGMTTTPGAGDLPAVPAELDRVHARCPIMTRLQSAPPGGWPDPSSAPGNPAVARVLAELPRHSWVHLSCHGSQDRDDPSASAFWLGDGPLRLSELIEHATGHRELAFLAACHTASGGRRVIDESISLAVSMQLLGYRHVIAALWSIYDSVAPDMADSVYADLMSGDVPDPARALHWAVTALRRHVPTDPVAWAPYIHIGP